MIITAEKAANLLLQQDNILVLCHRNPDGDAIGSAFALKKLLQSLGKRVRMECESGIPAKYDVLFGAGEDDGDFEPDYVVAVDTADRKLLGTLGQKYPTVNLAVDHHETNKDYAEFTYVEDKAAAAAEVVFKLAPLLGAKLDLRIATALYVGLSTDTGCFVYSNTTAETHIIAGELISYGVNLGEANKLLFETKTKSRVEIDKIALNSLEFFFGGELAFVFLPLSALEASGVSEDDLDGVSAMPRQIEGVKVGITLRERADGSYKASVRTTCVNAADICAKCGGGGHKRAAGCEFKTSFEEAKAALLESAKQVMDSEQ